jgi:hypothetical protein
MVLVTRKVLVMASILFFGDVMETAWFLSCTVMIIALLLHSFATPYEDALIDWCEFFALMSTLFTFMSAVVIKEFNDPSSTDANGSKETALMGALEVVIIFLTFANTITGAVINYRIVRHVYVDEGDGESDYRVKLIKGHLEDAKEQVEDLERVYEAVLDQEKSSREHRVAMEQMKDDFEAQRRAESDNETFEDEATTGSEGGATGMEHFANPLGKDDEEVPADDVDQTDPPYRSD